MNKLEQHLKALIEESGPVDVATFMSLATHHYYSTRDPFGTQGDFITAPEISQMFGEMIGVFLVDAWMKMGSPSPVALCEAGPGRGTLMADILRATKQVPGFYQAIRVHLIEMSPVLKEKQKTALTDCDVTWHETIETVPNDPLLFVANEFLDALPVRQYQFVDGNWRERLIAFKDNKFVFGLSSHSVRPPGFRQDVEEQDVWELATIRESFVLELSQRIKASQGVALLIDYGHDHSAPGDTLQAVKNHAYVDVLADIGEADLTSHVDFEGLKKAATGIAVFGPIAQGDFLKALGIELRVARLNKYDDMQRLIADDQMGKLFRVMALCHTPDIKLAGFNS